MLPPMWMVLVFFSGLYVQTTASAIATSPRMRTTTVGVFQRWKPVSFEMCTPYACADAGAVSMMAGEDVKAQTTARLLVYAVSLCRSIEVASVLCTKPHTLYE